MVKPGKKRIDVLLVENGLASTREQAQRLIMAGIVRADGQIVDKSGKELSQETILLVEGQDMPYVSRGGLKLEKAIRELNIPIAGKVALDVGASTGGFTDCLLQHGASRVYAVDVGYGQLDWRLRNDERVVNIEKTNIRNLDDNVVPEKVDVAVIDVSFISLTKVLPRVMELLKPGGMIVALIKPQFEVGKGQVGKGGVVREKEKHDRVLTDIEAFVVGRGLMIIGVTESPVLGAKGNKEFLMALQR